MGRYSNVNNKRGQQRVAAAKRPPKPLGECLFDRLPAEIVGLVLGFLPVGNLRSLLHVCRSWTTIIESDEPLWRRWCFQELPVALRSPDDDQTLWRAHFRQCVERHKVLVFNLDFQPEEVQVSSRQTLEDLIQQLRVKHPKLTANHSFYLRTDDGQWKLLGAGTPLYLNGLRGSGLRISISAHFDDVDFHNLDRHTIGELRNVYYNWGVPDPAWTKEKLIANLSHGKLSQFESAYADIDF